MPDDAKVIVRNILRVGAYLQRVGNRIIGPHGIRQQQFVVLNEILVRKTVSQKQLVGRLLYEKSNVSKIIKKLKDLHLIQTTSDMKDKRVKLLTPTARGEKIWKLCMADLNKWNKNWIAPLGKDDIKAAKKVLEQLNTLALSDGE